MPELRPVVQVGLTLATMHVVPVDDLVGHDTSGGDCPCGPATEPVQRDDGTIAWKVLHYALDGREQQERATGRGTGRLWRYGHEGDPTLQDPPT